MIQQIITLSLASMLQFGTPILISALGGVITENSGVVNIALEGLMRMGGFFSVVGSYYSGNPWIGLLLGMGVGLVMGLLHAYICVTWRGDQIVYGVAINIFALGGMTYLLERIFNTTGHSPSVPAFAQGVKLSQEAAFWLLVAILFLVFFTLFFLIFKRNKNKWLYSALSALIIGFPASYFISKIPVLLQVFWGAMNKQTIFVYFALTIPFLMHFLLYKTKWGLRIRAVGEHPKAADTLGVNVYLVRYLCVIASCILATISGASMSIGQLDLFDNNMPAGKGFIALAAMIFGKWKPLNTLLAVLFFTLAGVAGDVIQSLTTTYPWLANIPRGWLGSLPYILTLLALAGFVGRAVAPAADGIPYEKGEK
jgi:simple sugar transport system permease protein